MDNGTINTHYTWVNSHHNQNSSELIFSPWNHRLRSFLATATGAGGRTGRSSSGHGSPWDRATNCRLACLGQSFWETVVSNQQDIYMDLYMVATVLSHMTNCTAYNDTMFDYSIIAVYLPLFSTSLKKRWYCSYRSQWWANQKCS